MALKTYSITLENKMYGYERPQKDFMVEAESFQEAVEKARKYYNDSYAQLVKWKIL